MFSICILYFVFCILYFIFCSQLQSEINYFSKYHLLSVFCVCAFCWCLQIVANYLLFSSKIPLHSYLLWWWPFTSFCFMKRGEFWLAGHENVMIEDTENSLEYIGLTAPRDTLEWQLDWLLQERHRSIHRWLHSPFIDYSAKRMIK